MSRGRWGRVIRPGKLSTGPVQISDLHLLRLRLSAFREISRTPDRPIRPCTCRVAEQISQTEISERLWSPSSYPTKRAVGAARAPPLKLQWNRLFQNIFFRNTIVYNFNYMTPCTAHIFTHVLYSFTTWKPKRNLHFTSLFSNLYISLPSSKKLAILLFTPLRTVFFLDERETFSTVVLIV